MSRKSKAPLQNSPEPSPTPDSTETLRKQQAQEHLRQLQKNSARWEFIVAHFGQLIVHTSALTGPNLVVRLEVNQRLRAVDPESLTEHVDNAISVLDSCAAAELGG